MRLELGSSSFGSGSARDRLDKTRKNAIYPEYFYIVLLGKILKVAGIFLQVTGGVLLVVDENLIPFAGCGVLSICLQACSRSRF